MYLKAPEAQKALEKSNNISIPFPRSLALGSKLMLAYSRPTNISIVGSYARKTTVLRDGKVTIDLAVTMPSVGSLKPIAGEGFSKIVIESVPSQRLP